MIRRSSGFVPILAQLLPLPVFLGLAAYYERCVGCFVIDDAFIFFRYAENFINGLGLTWNPGGEAVEGYTSLLWLLWLSAWMGLGFDPLAAAKLSGVVFSALTLCLVTLGFQKWLEHETAAGAGATAERACPTWIVILPGLYLATNRSFAGWSVEAMDGKLFQLLLVAAWLVWLVQSRAGAARGRLPLTGALFALAALARPEGWLFAALAAALQAHDNRRRGDWRGFLPNLAVFLLIAGGQLVFRIYTYGDFVPNTFRAKVPGAQFDKGFEYLLLLFLENRLWLAAPLVMLGWRRCRDSPLPQTRFAGWGLALYFLYLLAIGGDYFEFRFFDYILPFWALLLGLGAVACRQKLASLSAFRKRLLAGGGAALLLLLNLLTVTNPPRSRTTLTTLEESARYTWEFGVAAHWLANNLPPGRTLAVRAAGIIPFVTRARTIDMLGMNDREIARLDNLNLESAIAHQRDVSPEYLRRRGVDYVISHPWIKPGPLPDKRYTAIELGPELYFSFMPLRTGAEFESGRIYRRDEHRGLREDWPLEFPPE